MSSVTLVHPAKTTGRNKMPFGRDTYVVPSNTVLDKAQVPTGRRDLGVGLSEPPVRSDHGVIIRLTTPWQADSDVAYSQITLDLQSLFVFNVFSQKVNCTRLKTESETEN